QPRPNSYGSRCGFVSPHSMKRSRAQFAARTWAGEPVSLAPISSVSVRYIGSARERCSPSALMRASTSPPLPCCVDVCIAPSVSNTTIAANKYRPICSFAPFYVYRYVEADLKVRLYDGWLEALPLLQIGFDVLLLAPHGMKCLLGHQRQ